MRRVALCALILSLLVPATAFAKKAKPAAEPEAKTDRFTAATFERPGRCAASARR